MLIVDKQFVKSFKTLFMHVMCVCCCQVASAPEGDSALHKFGSTTTQPTSQAVPPSYTSPQVPNILASGAINPTPEQVGLYRRNVFKMPNGILHSCLNLILK